MIERNEDGEHLALCLEHGKHSVGSLLLLREGPL